MIGKLHFSITLFLSYILFYHILFFDKLSSLILAFIVAMFSFIPDLDWKIYSWSNKQIIFLRKTKLKFILFPYYLFLIVLNIIFKHRTTTHSIFFSLIFFILGYSLLPFFYLISLAILLHILEDCLTVSGVKIFYPLSNFELKIPIINTKKSIFLQNVLSYLFLLITFFIFLFL